MENVNGNASTLDDYNYSAEVGPIRKLLWFCAGADPQLMARCPHSERVKEEGIGGVVLATAFLAFSSGSYALNFVFGSPWLAIFSGLIWALVIFNLDRFIITATGHGDGTHNVGAQEFFQATPRLLMAVIIGVCLSAPLEIRIFQTEIDAILQEKNDVNLAERSKNIVADFTQLSKENNIEINRIHSSIDKAESEYLVNIADKNKEATRIFNQKAAESASGVGEKTLYLQKSYEDIVASIADREARFKEAKQESEESVKALKAEINSALISKEAKLDKVKHDTLNVDGLAVRLDIMHEHFFWQSVFLMLLLTMIEVTPVITKMMLKNESYYYLMENQHQMVIAKYAIETKTSISVLDDSADVSETSNTKEEVSMIYHQAEAVLQSEKSKLETENALTKVAQLAFHEKVSEDIKNNPDKYISNNIESERT